MVNLTKGGNLTTIQEFACSQDLVDSLQKIIIPALNIPLAFTALLGNVLIIVALRKVTSLHPPSKLLFTCLANTDLCVGLISEPIYASVYLMSKEQSKRYCHYFEIISNILAAMFCGVSLFTLTAISVDRLLALSLGPRYRHVVTLRRVRVLVVSLWLSCTALAMLFAYSFRISLSITFVLVFLGIATSIFCYSKIFVRLRHHQRQVQETVHQGQPNGGGIPLNIARYRKTVSTALWVQGTLLLCYLPFGIVISTFVVTGLSTPALYFAWDLAASLVLLNSTLNPFLYCWKMREVKQAVKDTIRQLSFISS